jgi:molybdopterin molybdotransferase
MLSLAEARACIAAKARPATPMACPLSEARGRWLREEVLAPHDLPAFDRSSMDGYVVRLDDTSERFKLVGEVQPGAGSSLTIGPGECARIFTGAPIPPGASQVIMQEDTRREGEWMIPAERDRVTNIRYRGEDMREGDVVLPAGVRLRAPELSLLAHLGVTRPIVSPAPRVLHLATGRELVDPAEIPAPGQIRDSNSTLLAALLEEAGARLVVQDRCGDELETLVARIESVPAESWDLLLLSGGASVGDYDFGTTALRRLGFEIHFGKVKLKPGKPLVFASRGSQLAFVIPGNPVSHFILFHIAIRAALDALEGVPPAWPTVPVILAEAISNSAGPRETFWPARLEIGSPLRAHPLKWQSSGDLTGIRGANCILQIAAQSGPFPAGASVPALLLP